MTTHDKLKASTKHLARFQRIAIKASKLNTQEGINNYFYYMQLINQCKDVLDILSQEASSEIIVLINSK